MAKPKKGAKRKRGAAKVGERGKVTGNDHG